MAVRGRPFEPGNKSGRGRPRGSRNKATLMAQALLDGHSEALIKKCLHMALTGDTAAMRLCIERVLPTRRELPVSVAPMRGRTAAEIAQTLDVLLKNVASGQLTPAQAQTMASILEQQRRVIETKEHEARLSALEAQHATE
jgi:hypothetical protein